VKLNAKKTLKISICDGDDPTVLSKKFSKIFSLDFATQKFLENVIAQSMLNNNIDFSNHFFCNDNINNSINNSIMDDSKNIENNNNESSNDVLNDNNNNNDNSNDNFYFDEET
jgi:hypothetical protein